MNDSYDIPNSWRIPNITQSNEDRIGIAQAALSKTIPSIDPQTGLLDGLAYGRAPFLYIPMANFDLLTNGSQYESILQKYFQLALQGHPSFQSDLQWGYAALCAYKAYNSTQFVTWAEQAWNLVTTYTLSEQDISNGNNPVKNFTLASQCQAVSMAGGTFNNTDPDDPSIAALATGYYFVVSIALYEATLNQTYLSAALLSLQFIQSHLYSPLSIVQDTISARRNDTCSKTFDINPFNTGLVIEGLSILANVTQNSTQQDLLRITVRAAVTSVQWQDGTGICSDGTITRGLSSVYARNPKDSKLRSYVNSYLGVQYNALLDLATVPNSNEYARIWTGPPGKGFYVENQTNALDALIGVIGLRDDVSSQASPSPSPPSPSPSILPIVLGVVFGVIAIATVGFGFYCFRRTRKRQLVYGMWQNGGPESNGLPIVGPLIIPHQTASKSHPGPSVDPPFPLGTDEKARPDPGHINAAMRNPEVSLNFPAVPGSEQPQSGYFPDKSEPLISAIDAAEENRSQPAPTEAGEVRERTVGTTAFDLPLMELVRQLNERLQENAWEVDPEESPPTYQH